MSLPDSCFIVESRACNSRTLASADVATEVERPGSDVYCGSDRLKDRLANCASHMSRSGPSELTVTGFTEAFNRLADEQLLTDPGLVESLGQMHRGEYVIRRHRRDRGTADDQLGRKGLGWPV
jgi:hypothetical protein